MILLIAAGGVCLLLFLMIRFHLNAFIALIITSLVVGIAEGMGMQSSLEAVTKGLGSTLGSLALILAFGAMLGKLLEESGAALVLTQGLIKIFGEQNLQWAVLATSFIVGIPMIYNAGFLVIIPILYTIAITARMPMLFLGIPMCAALSVAHGFLPPHPAPSAIAILYKANINLTLFYGFLIALPALVLGGPVFGRFFKKVTVTPPPGLFQEMKAEQANLPSLTTSVLVALLPVFLMLIGLIVELSLPQNATVQASFKFLGDPNIALLIAVFAGVYFLGIKQNKKPKEVMQSLSASVGTIAMILLIIGAGGAFKQVLLESGVSSYIRDKTIGLPLSPLFMAWSISALLRLALGSATVAAITSAGIVLPMLEHSNIRPELMVLATTSGSLMFSHVNDIGFWMFKEYFNLSLKQTFLSWSIMESIISIIGLLGVLLLNAVL